MSTKTHDSFAAMKFFFHQVTCVTIFSFKRKLLSLQTLTLLTCTVRLAIPTAIFSPCIFIANSHRKKKKKEKEKIRCDFCIAVKFSISIRERRGCPCTKSFAVGAAGSSQGCTRQPDAPSCLRARCHRRYIHIYRYTHIQG